MSVTGDGYMGHPGALIDKPSGARAAFVGSAEFGVLPASAEEDELADSAIAVTRAPRERRWSAAAARRALATNSRLSARAAARDECERSHVIVGGPALACGFHVVAEQFDAGCR